MRGAPRSTRSLNDASQMIDRFKAAFQAVMGSLTAPLLPHHRTNGSRIRRLGRAGQVAVAQSYRDYNPRAEVATGQGKGQSRTATQREGATPQEQKEWIEEHQKRRRRIYGARRR